MEMQLGLKWIWICNSILLIILNKEINRLSNPNRWDGCYRSLFTGPGQSKWKLEHSQHYVSIIIVITSADRPFNNIALSNPLHPISCTYNLTQSISCVFPAKKKKLQSRQLCWRLLCIMGKFEPSLPIPMNHQDFQHYMIWLFQNFMCRDIKSHRQWTLTKAPNRELSWRLINSNPKNQNEKLWKLFE